jgi:hypothetical protein
LTLAGLLHSALSCQSELIFVSFKVRGVSEVVQEIVPEAENKANMKRLAPPLIVTGLILRSLLRNGNSLVLSKSVIPECF